MRGVNRVVISGNVTDKIAYSSTGNGVPTCTFVLASDRYTRDSVVTAWVKINVYGKLVEVCRTRLVKGRYVLVEGELMNRDGRLGELTEVRAKEVIFPVQDRNEQEGETSDGS